MKLIIGLLVPIIGSIGLLLLKIGMTQIGPVSWSHLQSPLRLFASISSNPFILIAISLYTVGFSLWLVMMSRLDLSRIFPFFAVVYILVPLACWTVLGERISTLRWTGIVIIMIGVIVAGWPD
jgi:drug/metabolite transporter (DMT)-like permease